MTISNVDRRTLVVLLSTDDGNSDRNECFCFCFCYLPQTNIVHMTISNVDRRTLVVLLSTDNGNSGRNECFCFCFCYNRLLCLCDGFLSNKPRSTIKLDNLTSKEQIRTCLYLFVRTTDRIGTRILFLTLSLVNKPRSTIKLDNLTSSEQIRIYLSHLNRLSWRAVARTYLLPECEGHTTYVYVRTYLGQTRFTDQLFIDLRCLPVAKESRQKRFTILVEACKESRQKRLFVKVKRKYILNVKGHVSGRTINGKSHH